MDATTSSSAGITYAGPLSTRDTTLHSSQSRKSGVSYDVGNLLQIALSAINLAKRSSGFDNGSVSFLLLEEAKTSLERVGSYCRGPETPLKPE